MPPPAALPEPFAGWFARRGWEPHPHQLALLARAADPATLLIAPTGGGKTLAGFLPEPGRARPRAAARPAHPLRLAAEGARRRHPPQPRRAARRDGPRGPRRGPHRRHRRPRARPPARRPAAHPAHHPRVPRADALLRGGAAHLRRPSPASSSTRSTRSPSRSAATSSMLGLARLQTLAPGLRRVGLSATVEDPPALAAFLGPATRVLARRPRPRARHLDPRDRGAAALGRPDRHLRRPRGDGPDPRRRAPPSSSSTPAPRPRCSSSTSGRRTTRPCPSRLHHGSLSREARARRSRRRWSRASSAPSSPPARSTSASTGATSTSSSRSARRRTSSASSSASAAPTTATTPPPAPSSSPRTASRCSNAAPPSTPSTSTPSTARRAAPARSTSSASTSCSPPAPARSTPTPSSPRSRPPAPTAPCRAPTSTPASPTAPPAATRSGPTTAGSASTLRDGRWQLRDPRRARAIRMNVGTIVTTELLKVRLKGRGGAPLGRDRGGLRRLAHPRRHLPLRRRDRPLRIPARDDRRGHPPGLRLAQGRGLRRHQARHLDAPLAPGDRAPRRPRRLGRPARPHAGLAVAPGRGQPHAPPRPSPRRDLPARPAPPPLPLRLRRPQRPPDPRPAGDPAHGAPRASTRSASSPTTTRS